MQTKNIFWSIFRKNFFTEYVFFALFYISSKLDGGYYHNIFHIPNGFFA